MNQDIIDELSFQAEYELTKDESVKPEGWTDDYTQGYHDGLQRAIELIKERE